MWKKLSCLPLLAPLLASPHMFSSLTMSFSLTFLHMSECIEIGSLQLAKKFTVNTVQHETELQTKHELQYTDSSLDLHPWHHANIDEKKGTCNQRMKMASTPQKTSNVSAITYHENVLDTKSETVPEPKPSTSRSRKSTKSTKPTSSEWQLNDMDTST